MVKVRVPATTANLGPGFDTLGMALSLFLEVEMAFSDQGDLVKCSGNDARKLEDPNQNLVLQSARHVLGLAGKNDSGLQINMNNGIPTGKGLGSSASAIAAGMVAANELIARPFTRKQILRYAVEMEGHPDNIVPAMEGGLTTALMSQGEVFWQKIIPPAGLKTVLAVPDFELPTHQSRTVLPETVTLKEVINSLQKSCYLLASIANGQLDQLQLAMNDELIQPRRKSFIPGFDQVLRHALEAGAKGAALSGAGSSVIALSTGREQEIGLAMQEAFLQAGVESKIYILDPCIEGISIY